MLVNKWVMSVFLLLTVASAAVGFFHFTNELRRMQNNVTASFDTIHREVSKTGEYLYKKMPMNLTRAEFKEIFTEEFEQTKEYNLRAVNQITKIATEVQQQLETIATDTIINGQQARTWIAKTPSITITGIELPDNKRIISFRNYIALKIYSSKIPRKGIKKLFLWQKRPDIITAVPSDTSVVITDVQLINVR